MPGLNVDAAVAEAEQLTEVEPTDGQKEAGNYKKGHVKIDGFDVTIEQPKGSVRSGVDASGKPWSQEMHNTYGYIRGTEGVDGDHIDVFLSDHMDDWNGNVYVVDQVNKDRTFDEHKVMYGFDSEQEAREAYLSNYEEGWTGLGNITGVTRDEFKKWVDSSHRKTKPFAEYSSVKPLQSTGTDNHQRFSLSEEDREKQTHSDAFKAWFGDWEKITNFAKKINQENNESGNQRNAAADSQRRQATDAGLLGDAQARIKRRDGDVLQTPQQGVQSEEDIDRRNREDEETLEQFSKEQGKWIDEVDQHLEENYGVKFDSGSEAYAYRKDNDTVIKSRSLTGYETVQDALDSIEIHNRLFPETAMKVVAFGRSDGELTVVLEQPFIDGHFATNEEISAFVSDLFNAEKDDSVIGGTSYKTASFLLQDLKPKNVIVKTVDGKKQLYVIDGDFYYTPEYKEYLNTSKVVDSEGRPLVVYHVDRKGSGFTIFDTSMERNRENMGSHFGTEAASDVFAEDRPNAKKYAVYLDLKNPLEVDDYFADDNSYWANLLVKLVKENNIDDPKVNEVIADIHEKWPWIDGTIETYVSGEHDAERDSSPYQLSPMPELYNTLRDVVERLGYDGFKYMNLMEDAGNYRMDKCGVGISPSGWP